MKAATDLELDNVCFDVTYELLKEFIQIVVSYADSDNDLF